MLAVIYKGGSRRKAPDSHMKSLLWMMAAEMGPSGVKWYLEHPVIESAWHGNHAKMRFEHSRMCTGALLDMRVSTALMC